MTWRLTLPLEERGAQPAPKTWSTPITLAAPTLAPANAATAVAVAPASEGSHSANSPPPREQTIVTASCSQDPSYATLTTAEKLDRSMTYPSMHGVLRGTVGTPRTGAVPAAGLRGGTTDDYPFTPRRFVGKTATPPYPLGQVMSLRVPSPGTFAECGGRPVLSGGDDVYVVVRDQGQVAGGHTATVLVATSATDVYTVRDGVVHGHGTFAGFAEPIAQFESHFRQP